MMASSPGVGFALPLVLLLACQPEDDAPPRPSPTAPVTADDTGTDICAIATWEVAAEPTLRTWCTPCHSSTLEGAARSGAPEGMDFDTWETTAPLVAAIQAVAVPDNATMPPEGIPSAEERAWLGHWIDCGAPGTPVEEGPCDVLLAAPYGSTDPCATGHNQVVEDLVLDPAADASCLCEIEGSLAAPGRTELSLPLLAHLGGDLDVAGTELATLSAPELRQIGGSLVLEGMPQLTVLDLPALHTVGGEVRVTGATSLPRLELQQLSHIGSDLVVDQLVGVSEVWLPRVEVVGGSYRVTDNPDLTDLPFFFDLDTVGADLVVRNNPQLAELLLGNQVSSIGGSVEVGGNQLVELELLHQLPEIPGELYIHDEPALLSLKGLAVATRVGGPVWLENLPSLAQITSLPMMDDVGGLLLDGVGPLPSPSPSRVTRVGGDVRVSESEVSSLPFLGLVEQIDGDLELTDLPMFESTTALHTLQSVGGEIHVARTALPQASLPTLEQSGSIVLDGNSEMVFVALPQLVVIHGGLSLTALPITDVRLRGGLTIEGDLVLDDLDALDELTAFHEIGVLDGALVVVNNLLLDASDVAALDAAIAVHGGPVIEHDNGP